MTSWLDEVIEQVALGEFLAGSPLGCGQRFGLIAVDNAVEFMLVAYVEIQRRLVGGHIPGGISKPNWEQKKRQFADLLSYVVSLEPRLQPEETDINNFHDLRSRLYHTGTPVTVAPKYVFSYSKVARKVLDILFSIRYAEDHWESVVSDVGVVLSRAVARPGIRRSIKYERVDGCVRFLATETPTHTDAILLALHGYAMILGQQPARPLLLKSLALSGCDMEPGVLKARLYEMRRKRWIHRENLRLTATGRKELQRKYVIS